ncbi:Hypothetical predicted protein [Xyrichtys novacula]|uniref:Uncharacterized protein n=1 Tax=Xyrichtys novacula TaxID=13765 RepID=A0AAV1F1K0_XYRNO|nr:Hypothetical predicted protein [Xyrichtys novacula]
MDVLFFSDDIICRLKLNSNRTENNCAYRQQEFISPLFVTQTSSYTVAVWPTTMTLSPATSRAPLPCLSQESDRYPGFRLLPRTRRYQSLPSLNPSVPPPSGWFSSMEIFLGERNRL